MGDLGGPYQAIVIGSGMSGLAAANLLAQAGMSVLVLEQGDQFGGYMQRFYLDKTPFDSGCHYVGSLGPGQTFSRYLDVLGIKDTLKVRALDPEGFDHLDLGDSTFDIPVGRARFEARLIERFPHERDGLRRYFQRLDAELRKFPMYSLESGKATQGDWSDETETLSQVLDATVRDPRAREILVMHNVLYAVPPHEAPFSLHAFVTDHYLQGAYFIEGGGAAVTKALLDRLAAHGGVARRKRRVVSLDIVDRKIRGVRTHRGEYAEAPLVIAAIEPRRVVEMLPPEAVRPAYRRRVEALRPGISAFAAYMLVKGGADADVSRLARRNHLYVPDGNASVFTDAWATGPSGPSGPLGGTRPALHVSSHSAGAPGHTGPHAVTAIALMSAAPFEAFRDSGLGERPDEYLKLKERLGARVLETVAGFAPELVAGLVKVDFATPLTHRDYTLNEAGAIYGTHHAIDQVGPRGVGWRTRVEGLLLAGHSVMYPGLMGATMSAFYACGEVLGLEALHQRLLAT